MADNIACVDCPPETSQPTVAAPQPATAAQNLLDPSTFIPPSSPVSPSVTIEFCDRVSIYAYV
ncbi:hypothetical protein TRAPUB_9891 [Trametes pubescens]|uniref:Uncharacterized protein n=1 Tax=Trametes pubescens TaxID=154538 RepID=A0A1M2W0Z9_TRAPU|nr:hypothetical protein TRAPUB_9891 [Trametes pubescens]